MTKILMIKILKAFAVGGCAAALIFPNITISEHSRSGVYLHADPALGTGTADRRDAGI